MKQELPIQSTIDLAGLFLYYIMNIFFIRIKRFFSVQKNKDINPTQDKMYFGQGERDASLKVQPL